jgi:nicotinamidase-related amidase
MLGAIVVVDMLNEFLHGRAEQLLVPPENVPGLIANVRALVDRARRAKLPVVFLACAHDAGDLIFRAIRPHALRGTWEAQIVADLLPAEWLVEKKVYDGFYETQLDALLRGLAVDELFLAGAQTDCCVHATGQGAIFRGLRACVVAECTDTCSAERQRVGLERYRDLIGPVVHLSDPALGF